MNARSTIIHILKDLGYTVCDSEGIDILLNDGTAIKTNSTQCSAVINAKIFDIEDESVTYSQLLEAANILNEGFLLHTKYYVSEEWLNVYGSLSLDYINPFDLRYKLQKAMLLMKRLPFIFNQVLELVRMSDMVDVSSIWNIVTKVNVEIAREIMAGKTILYIHGFASSGNSGTAREIQKLLPESHVISPDLPVDPDEAYDMLCHLLEDEEVDIIVGTSMGGMFANVLNSVPKVLVNPSFHVSESMRKKIGKVSFFKKRADGATEFEVTTELCDKYQMLERRQFAFFHERNTGETFALFGTEDNVIDCHEEYCRYFGDAYKNVSCGHRLTTNVIKKDLLPIMAELVGRNSQT